MDNFITREENDFKNIFNRFRKKNFSGNTGQAIKNSSYQLATNIVTKVGSLIFTIIIARFILSPELFGLYSLALATILFFSAFADLGAGAALLTFVSESLGKKHSLKAKSYLRYLTKLKLYLILSTSAVLILLSSFIANNYYNKPIFYALLAGALYVPATEAMTWLERIFQANNNFKFPLIKELIFQILRFTIVPLIILMLLKSGTSNQAIIAILILVLVFCYLVSTLFLLFFAAKKIPFLKEKKNSLMKQDLIELKKFIIPLSVIVLSGVFFGYIDTLMLGHFIPQEAIEYIGYYGVAFNFIGAGVAIISFASTALLPLFSRMQGKSLVALFKKSRNMIALVSLAGALFTYLIAKLLINLTYGPEYLEAVPILRWFSILVLILPIIAIYSTYLTSMKKTKVLAWLIISSTILNIVLNFIGINIGLKFGVFEAVLGATFATIISRFIYLGGLIIFRNR